jgi:hypothetical protein
MAPSAENVVVFYNKRGTCEQWIKEGKIAIKWTRLSCRSFAANAVRLQLHALAYNLGNFLRTLAAPEPIKDSSLTSLKEKMIKIGAKIVSHRRYVAFQMAEVAIAKNLFAEILRLIAELLPPAVAPRVKHLFVMRHGKPQEDCRSASSAAAQLPATQQMPPEAETAVSKLIREKGATIAGEKGRCHPLNRGNSLSPRLHTYPQNFR